MSGLAFVTNDIAEMLKSATYFRLYVGWLVFNDTFSTKRLYHAIFLLIMDSPEGLPAIKGEKTHPGHICTIMQNFTPIGATVEYL